MYQQNDVQGSHNTNPRHKPKYITSTPDKDFLPFEKQSKILHKRILKDSTITDAEAKMFQSLLALQRPPTANKPAEKSELNEEGLHSTLSKVIGVQMHQPQTLNSRSSNEDRQAAQQTSDASHGKAAGAVRRVASLLKDAQTDLRMWEILHEEAIRPVLDMKLDASDGNDPADLAPEVIEHFSQAFPRLLVSYQDVLQEAFPSSQYALAVLPYLRSLGPSTFALGVSTSLYNHHLRSLYDQRTDLRAMIETLSEMHENVFDFDSTTLAIVERALRNASRAIQQPFYSPRNCFWSARLRKDAVEELEAWVGTIKDGITDRALHEARDGHPKTIGYIGQHDDSEAFSGHSLQDLSFSPIITIMDASTIEQKFLKSPDDLGLVAVGFSGGQCKPGVDAAPMALIESGLVNQLKEDLKYNIHYDGQVHSYSSLLPSDDADHRGMKKPRGVSAVTQQLSNQVYTHAREGRFVLTLGGDHSIAIGTISGTAKAIRERLGREIAVIWVDAHADINTPETSDSGNIHGMPVAFLTGLATEKEDAPFGWIKEEHRLNLKKLVYIGLRDVDRGEKKILREHGIKAFSMHDIDRYGIGRVMEMALGWIGTDTPIHLSFDVDALDPMYAPSTGTPVRGGLTLREGDYIAECVHETGSLVALDLVEVNPSLEIAGAQETVRAGVSIVRCALGDTLL
ncbi:hypothetical protein AMS68_005346 [Peltaster fructicola]|uniref:Arginase n=1 Tax=Peltaster fructicola TaxID=286661 RepID=A0A6H0XYZ1_9PEZI|nr:hypothetical protein AMS68_005346 [Peltaster fructicola]